MNRAYRLFRIYWPFVLAIIIELFAIQKASWDSDAPKARCDIAPSQLAVVISFVGIAIAIIGAVRIFRTIKRPPHVIWAVVLLLIVIVGSLAAGFELNFMATWCF